MTNPIRSTSTTPREQFDVLAWDSDRFGFPVARIHSSIASAELESVVDQMRRCGIVLAYLSMAADSSEIDDEILSRLSGRLVDHRVTYTANLNAELNSAPVPNSLAIEGGLRVTEYRSTAVSLSLNRLARESGTFSRFRIDPQLAPGVFEAIYDAWIRRSVNHEIADEVLVARDARRIVGFVSLKANGSCGEIGLLAVDRSQRGRGVGGLLVRAAHSSMMLRGCTQARVATQRANRGACALYESAGYVVDRIERVYHLWLSNGEPVNPKKRVDP